MGIFARLAQLIKSNLNDLISRSEDPEKMLNQIVLDMNTQLAEATKQVAVAIADEKRLAKQVEAEAAQGAEWRRRAEMAVRAGNDELAKEALQRKKEHDTLRAGYESQWVKQKAAVDQLKTSLTQLNNKIEDAKRKKNLLVARAKRAEAQKTIASTMSGMQENSAFDNMKRMEEKIDKLEADAKATFELASDFSGDTLDKKFAALETVEADDALAALKAKMGLQAAPAIPAASEQTTDSQVEAEAKAEVEATVGTKS